MFSANDVIDVRVDSPTRLVSQVLQSAGREDLATGLELPQDRKAFAEEFVALAIALGATVEIQDEPIDAAAGPAARMLVPGTRIHIRMKRLSWRTALAVVPIIGGIVATGGGLLPLLGLVPLLTELKDAIALLSEEDKAIVVAVTALGKQLGRPVTADDIRQALPAPTGAADAIDMNDALKRLSTDGVLRWDATGYYANF